ncbi:MAG TPA: rhodanese-like domain-containing protein [Pyrinomonadaceae bacterium]|nr:rhodanese-like domain-containing protein [Pyrinomonadaceae bacterium]
MMEEIEIVNGYEFRTFLANELPVIKETLAGAMRETGVRGTVILATEGFNASLCGTPAEIAAFIPLAEAALATTLALKVSYADSRPLRKIDVKIKPEIVTLKQPVDIALGEGTHISPAEWNELIRDPETLVLDTRNAYEFETGTFAGAVNPEIEKFSELPEYVAEKLSPENHKRIAMFCTGGIRCEKFAPFMLARGFQEVYQLKGGILKYLEEVPREESLWEGECFVFDERTTLDNDLRKGVSWDRSKRHSLPDRAELK